MLWSRASWLVTRMVTPKCSKLSIGLVIISLKMHPRSCWTTAKQTNKQTKRTFHQQVGKRKDPVASMTMLFIPTCCHRGKKMVFLKLLHWLATCEWMSGPQFKFLCVEPKRNLSMPPPSKLMWKSPKISLISPSKEAA